MSNSTFVGATAPVNFAASVASSNVRWAGVPVLVESVQFSAITDGVWDILAFCDDGSRRKLRIKRELLNEEQLERARLQVKVLQDAAQNRTPLLFAVVGNNSVKQWFCDFTDDFVEVKQGIGAPCPF